MNRQTIILVSRCLIVCLFLLLPVGCQEATTRPDPTESLTAADFGVPENSGDSEHDDGHVDGDGHDQDEHEGTAGADDGSLADGTLLDHHGMPIDEGVYQKVEIDGVVVEFTVEGFSGLGGRGTILDSNVSEGSYAAVKFNLTDSVTGEPLTALRPSAWMDPHAAVLEHAEELACRSRVETYLQGLLNARAQVDFNGFFILGLNEDATVSVIDPLANVGGMTQLYAMILLKQPGEDWVISADQSQVFISMPAANEVAVLTTASFQVEQDLPAGSRPVRVALQPDGNYVWVGNDASNPDESGVTIIDPALPAVVGFVPTGAGHHELAFSPDNRYAYVTNADDGTLAVVDIATKSLVDVVTVGTRPVAIDVSISGDVYVLDEDEGTIVVLDGETLTQITSLGVAPGAATLRFEPAGRWAFSPNPRTGELVMIDGATRQVTHRAVVDGSPDQVAFSAGMAYVRLRDRAQIVTIPLLELDSGGDLPLVTVPVGTQPPGAFPTGARAGAIYPAADNAGVMVANPADGQIHYYVEGATSALGSFEGHGRHPRAALIVDRSLQEEAPGLYVGRVRIPQDGEYEVAFFMGEPAITHCFYFSAAPNPELERAEDLALPKMEILAVPERVAPGEPFVVQVRLTNSISGVPLTELSDVQGLVGPVSGIWQDRVAAGELEPGVYQLVLKLDAPGRYNMFFTVPSLGATPDAMPRLMIPVEVEN